MSVQPEYDPSQPNGGDSLEVDVNAQYAGVEVHYIYIMICAFLVWYANPNDAISRRVANMTIG